MFRSPPEGLHYWILPVPLATDPNAPPVAKVLWGHLYAKSADGPFWVGHRELARLVIGRSAARNRIRRAIEYLVTAGWVEIIPAEGEGQRAGYLAVIPEGGARQRATPARQRAT